MTVEIDKKSVKSEQTEGSVKIWDLRPGPDFGLPEGKGARQLARVKQLEKVGALISGNSIEGSGTNVVYDYRKSNEEYVIACEPIPMSEMAPDATALQDEFVTPLWPDNRPDWIRTQTNNRRKEV